jgi:hypothetical protein
MQRAFSVELEGQRDLTPRASGVQDDMSRPSAPRSALEGGSHAETQRLWTIGRYSEILVDRHEEAACYLMVLRTPSPRAGAKAMTGWLSALLTPEAPKIRHRFIGPISILNSHKKKESALFIPLATLILISCFAALYLLLR